MQNAPYDLILKGGRVIDPAQGLDGVMDVDGDGRKEILLSVISEELVIDFDGTNFIQQGFARNDDLPSFSDIGLYWSSTPSGVSCSPSGMVVTTLMEGSDGSGFYVDVYRTTYAWSGNQFVVSQRLGPERRPGGVDQNQDLLANGCRT